MHRVTVVLPPDPVLFDFVSAFTVFAACPGDRYRVSAFQGEPGPTVARWSIAVEVDRDRRLLEEAQTIVVPGVMDYERPPPEALLEDLRQAHARGCRIASVCSGAFVLAAAGLLDGRRATTHWECAARLAERYPEVQVDPAVLYVDEGDVLTSAGASAGMDLCLHMIADDCGEATANAVARRLVFGPHRSGGQAQYIERPIAPTRSCSLEATRRWLLERLDRPVTVPEMAAHACLSVRAFARRFQDETGTSPHQWLIGQRVQMARQLLESTDLPVDQVARHCGFGSSLAFRQQFKRRLRASPAAYRRLLRRNTAVESSSASVTAIAPKLALESG